MVATGTDAAKHLRVMRIDLSDYKLKKNGGLL